MTDRAPGTIECRTDPGTAEWAHRPPFHRIGARCAALSIGNTLVHDLASRYGTPLYVMDGQVVRGQIRSLTTALAQVPHRLLFSVKANPGLRLAKTCLDLGLGLDACSKGDVEVALRAGASPEWISYTGVGLTSEDMAWLADKGVWVNLDSASEARRWASVLPGRPVGLRVSPGIAAGFHEHCRAGAWNTKFGIEVNEVPLLAEHLKAHGCSVETLHVHLGSSISDERPYLAAFDLLLSLAARIPTVCRVNLGGGISAPFHPDDGLFPLNRLGDSLRRRLASFRKQYGRDIGIVLEPGEYLASEAGYLLTRVLVTKERSNGSESLSIAIVDGGMNLLPAHALYGTYVHVYVDGKEAVGSALRPTDVCGNTNHAGDRLASGRSLPPLQEGDLLVVRNAGAYAFARSTRFNELPRPGTVWVEGNRDELIQAAEQLDDQLSGQRP